MTATSTASRSSSRGTDSVRRSPGVAPKELPLRRRWGRVAAGGAVALAGGVLSAQIYMAAGNRVEVVVMATDVTRHQEITADDLAITRVAADQDVAVIRATQLEEMVGRVASRDLVEGTLPSAGHLRPADEPTVGADQSIVPLSLSRSQVVRAVDAGTEVRVVIESSGRDEGDAPREIPGWVLSVQDGERGRSQNLEVVVARESGPDVALAADAGNVLLVVDGVH